MDKSVGDFRSRLLRPEQERLWEDIALVVCVGNFTEVERLKQRSFMGMRKIIATSKHRGGRRHYPESQVTTTSKDKGNSREVIEAACGQNALCLWQVKVLSQRGSTSPRSQ